MDIPCNYIFGVTYVFSFQWDPAKAAANLRKHGVSFETARRVFYDPMALFEQDRIENGEYSVADARNG